MDYRDKIRKLLNLSKSPVEAEAKAALLKAHELMAEHKLSQEDFADLGKKEVVTKDLGYSYTRRMGDWIPLICEVIAKHWLCVCVESHRKYAKTYTAKIMGLKEDVDVCTEIINYAIGYVESYAEKFKAVNYRVTPKILDHMVISYARGFGVGIEAMYARQEKAREDWALVLKLPSEVQDAIKDMRSKEGESYEDDPSMFKKGYCDGLKFDPSTKLKDRVV